MSGIAEVFVKNQRAAVAEDAISIDGFHAVCSSGVRHPGPLPAEEAAINRTRCAARSSCRPVSQAVARQQDSGSNLSLKYVSHNRGLTDLRDKAPACENAGEASLCSLWARQTKSPQPAFCDQFSDLVQMKNTCSLRLW